MFFMQDMTPEARAVLEKMLARGIVGGHHLLVDNILRRFPTHKRGDIRRAVEDLVRLGLVGTKKTKHGDAIFIPPERLDEVKQIVEEAS
jgi:hypothetical protein